jgi:hypothetical protein
MIMNDDKMRIIANHLTKLAGMRSPTKISKKGTAGIR